MRNTITLDGKKIAILQIEKELDLKDIVEFSGLSKTTVSCAKSGKRCAPKSADRIAAALGVDVTEIMKEA